jgi:SAM-dependent methyltransferase
MINQIKKEINEYYKIRRNSSTDSSFHMGWKNLLAQEIRFIQLLKIIEREETFSINDLGCGNGSLLRFMNENIRDKSFAYNGYDIMPEMIAEAKTLNINNESNFKLITSVNEIENTDYTVASGIFNLKYNTTEKEWLNYIHETIAVMWAKSTIGISFNCLTSYSDKEFMRPELFYADPMELFDFCKKNITRHVSILHDYREYDFTVLLRK